MHDRGEILPFFLGDMDVVRRTFVIDLGRTDQGEIVSLAPRNQKNDTAFFVEERDRLVPC